MALSVEETKLRLICDVRPLNKRRKKVNFSMDTVARVANVASQGCYMTSLYGSSAFHRILLRPSSWPLLASRTAALITAGAFAFWLQFESMVPPYPQRGERSLPLLQRDPGVSLRRRLVVV